MTVGSGRVLVTGGTGFIGSLLSHRLREAGREVVLLTRPGSARPRPDGAGIEVVSWPATQEDLRRLVDEAGVSGVIHLAAHFVAEHGPHDVAALVSSNVGSTAAVADAAAAAGVERFVSAGTVWQNATGPSYQPVSLYAATKQAAQDVLEHFAVNAGLKVLTVKLPDTYGPGDTRRKAVDLLLAAARDQQQLDMSPGEQILDLVHVDDVAAAFVLALDAPIPDGRVVALSSGRPIPLREVARIVSETAGVPLPITWGARPYRAREKFDAWNAGPALDGWAPVICLEDGIARLWRAL